MGLLFYLAECSAIYYLRTISLAARLFVELAILTTYVPLVSMLVKNCSIRRLSVSHSFRHYYLPCKSNTST